jgi:trans-aconitate methyltransferase
MRNWADAPVFPTPLNALADVPRHAPLPWGARVLDAGCGVGDGLLALRQAYPDVQLEGLEFSRPLSWLARWRCSWAVIHHADMWQTDWGAYQLVYLFQRPETMARAVHKARQELAPGAWLVSLEFAAPELKPQASVSLDGGRSVWLYQAPFEQA